MTSKKHFGLGRLKFWCKTEDKISYEVSDKNIRDEKVLSWQQEVKEKLLSQPPHPQVTHPHNPVGGAKHSKNDI